MLLLTYVYKNIQYAAVKTVPNAFSLELHYTHLQKITKTDNSGKMKPIKMALGQNSTVLFSYSLQDNMKE